MLKKLWTVLLAVILCAGAALSVSLAEEQEVFLGSFSTLNLQSKCNREKNSDSKLRIPYNTSCPDKQEGSCSNEPLHPSYHRRARKYTAHAGREERNQGDSQRTTTVSFNNKQRDLPESGTQR